jgi:hypothetical protein
MPHVASDDLAATVRLGELLAASATAREMIDTLRRSPHVVARLRSDATLQRRTGVPGRGLLRVHGHLLLAMVEFDDTAVDARRQLLVIAHELAHLVEAAGLPDVNTTATLRARLELAAYRRSFDIARIRNLESPFATSVGTRVGEELRAEKRLPGHLRTLADTHQVTLPR